MEDGQSRLWSSQRDYDKDTQPKSPAQKKRDGGVNLVLPAGYFLNESFQLLVLEKRDNAGQADFGLFPKDHGCWGRGMGQETAEVAGSRWERYAGMYMWCWLAGLI